MTTTPDPATPSDEHQHAPADDVQDERAGDPTARDDATDDPADSVEDPPDSTTLPR